MKRIVLCLLMSLSAIGGACAEVSPPVLFDFYADWCAPCREMRPTVDALRAAGYRIEPIDIDSHQAMAAAYNVASIPCFVMAAEGRETDRVVGPASYERLEAMFRTTPQRPTPAWRYESATGHRRAVVRVFCEDATGRSIGSGTLITWNGRLAVLTARHVVKDAKRIAVWFCTGKTHSARVLSADATWDVAVLALEGVPEDVAPIELERGDKALQQKGDRLESCGYGPDARLACNSGVFLGYRRSAAMPQGPDDWMVISGRARSGDSGGPVFNSRSRLVGVLWGTDGKEVVCVQAGRIHVVLDAALPPQPLAQKSVVTARIPTPPVEPGDSMAVESLPVVPATETEASPQPFDRAGKNVESRCAPRTHGRTSPSPNVTVQSDPEVRRTLGSIDTKVGVLIEQRQADTAAEGAAKTEPSPLAAGLCILGAMAAGVVVYFATQKG